MESHNTSRVWVPEQSAWHVALLVFGDDESIFLTPSPAHSEPTGSFLGSTNVDYPNSTINNASTYWVKSRQVIALILYYQIIAKKFPKSPSDQTPNHLGDSWVLTLYIIVTDNNKSQRIFQIPSKQPTNPQSRNQVRIGNHLVFSYICRHFLKLLAMGGRVDGARGL